MKKLLHTLLCLMAIFLFQSCHNENDENLQLSEVKLAQTMWTGTWVKVPDKKGETYTVTMFFKEGKDMEFTYSSNDISYSGKAHSSYEVKGNVLEIDNREMSEEWLATKVKRNYLEFRNTGDGTTYSTLKLHRAN